MRLGPALVIVIAVSGLPGCGGRESWYHEAGIGAAVEWSGPPAMQAPSSSPVLDILFLPPDGMLSGQITVLDSGEPGELLALSGALHLSPILEEMFYGLLPENILPVLVPEVGVWFGDDTPESGGLFTGLRVGGGYWIRGPEDRLVTVDYRWLKFHDISGEEEATAQAVSVRYLW